MSATQCMNSCRYESGDLIDVYITHQDGMKGDFSDFERDVSVGARWAGMSSETADLLGKRK